MTKFRFLKRANQGTHDLDPKPFVAGASETQKPEFGHFTISDFFSRNSYYSTVPRVRNPVNVTTFWGVTTLLLRHPRVLGIIVNVLEVS